MATALRGPSAPAMAIIPSVGLDFPLLCREHHLPKPSSYMRRESSTRIVILSSLPLERVCVTILPASRDERPTRNSRSPCSVVRIYPTHTGPDGAPGVPSATRARGYRPPA